MKEASTSSLATSKIVHESNSNNYYGGAGKTKSSGGFRDTNFNPQSTSKMQKNNSNSFLKFNKAVYNSKNKID